MSGPDPRVSHPPKRLGYLVPTMLSYVQFLMFTDRIREQAMAAKHAADTREVLVSGG